MKTNSDLIRKLVEDSAITFATETEKHTFIDDWYFARAFISSESMKEMMCRVENNGNMKDALNITLEGISPRMCAVLREIILRAHYTDFNEHNGENTSIITILYNGSEDETKNILLKKPFLGNFFHYLWVEHQDYLDIEIKLTNKVNEVKNLITENMLANFQYEYNSVIDTRLAEIANQIYCIGDDLYNLPSIDTTNADIYELPMRVFEAENYEYDRQKDWIHNSTKDKLSNVFCTDTFDLRVMMLKRGLNKEGIKEKTLTELVRKNILLLSKCEHSRWVAEKLILGFRPWTPSEHYQYDRLFKDEKKQFYSKLKKKEEAHYNICSYEALSRLEPQNMKFDTFLVLVMLDIVLKSEKSHIG